MGDSAEINGIAYTIVDEANLRQMVANNDDVLRLVHANIPIESLFKDQDDYNRDISSWDTSNVTNILRYSSAHPPSIKILANGT